MKKKQAQENNLKSKKHERRNKTPRLALFSENEREYLHGRADFDTVRKSQFYHNLDLRFYALLRDLELLGHSAKLKSWRSFRASNYKSRIKKSNYFEDLFSDIEHGYESAIHRISKNKGKNKKIIYWIDHSPIERARRTKPTKIDERVFNKDWLFRHIKKKLTDSEEKLFLRAYNHGNILPFKKEDAISIDEIKKRLSGESQSRANNIPIKNITEKTFKDPRNLEIISIIEKHRKRSIKALNKKLSKFDSKIMRYLVNPHFHGESE